MITKIVASVFALAVGWISVLALVMVVSTQAPAAVVPFPTEAFLAALPAQVSISQHVGWGVVLISEDAAFVSALYDAGARLVLPAGLMGCAPV